MKKIDEDKINREAEIYASNRASQGYYLDKMNAFIAGAYWAQAQIKTPSQSTQQRYLSILSRNINMSKGYVD